MASAAEQMAANLNWGSFGKAKELQARILFAIGLLIVYRVGTYITVPGIDTIALREYFAQASQGLGGMINAFTGGAVGRGAVLSLGIMPYISASIIVQLMTAMVPSLESLKKDGEAGRKKINQYTRYGTVALATVQAYAIAVGLEGRELALDPGMFFRITCVITLVCGTMFLLWLGEQITQRGIGNGVSLIIFVGIIAELPAGIAQFLSQGRSGVYSTGFVLGLLVLAVVLVLVIVFMERALRKIHIQYPRRQVGQQMYGGESSNLPVKLNPSGVIPAIFASAVLLMPATFAGFTEDQGDGVMGYILAYLGRGQPLYLLAFAALIIFFAYFYTANVAFKSEDVADNLKKQGGFIPGIRPGARTVEYLDYVVARILAVGSLYLAVVCLLPELLFSGSSSVVPFFFGGTSLLIVVSVTMDTITQVQSHMLAHQYEGLIERSQLRGKGKGKAKGRTRSKVNR